MSTETDNVKDLFGSIQFLEKMYGINLWLGVIMSAVILALWVIYAVYAKKWKWQQALSTAGDGLKKVASESVIHNTNTENGDNWKP